jgi:fimbrial isopeptide formation D2 family protein
VTDPKVSGLICGDGTNLAPGGSIICNATHSVTQADITAGHYLNTACVTATGLDATCASATVASATLSVAKSNNAPVEELELPDGTTASLPTAKEGSTVTFTLTYSVGTSRLTNGVITDVLPIGLTYVEGSATNSTDFTFVPPFNTTTRTLTWTAANVTAGGSVTYKAKVNKGAAALDQPLTNIATIDSAQTAPSSDTSDVFVPVPPLAETHVPTAPPTDTLESSDAGQGGTSLPLILAILGVILLAVAFVTPVPAVVRRRNRR